MHMRENTSFSRILMPERMIKRMLGVLWARNWQRHQARKALPLICVIGVVASLALIEWPSTVFGQSLSGASHVRVGHGVPSASARKKREEVVKGRVLDCAGLSVVGAKIEVLGLAQTRGEGSTDADGRFSVAVKECGPFVVRVGASGSYLGTWMDGAMPDCEVALTVRRGTLVRIRLTDAKTGHPISREEVTWCTCSRGLMALLFGSELPHYRQLTDTNGELAVLLERGVWKITITGDTFQTVLAPIDASKVRDEVLDVRVSRIHRRHRFIRIVDSIELLREGFTALLSRLESTPRKPVEGVSLTSGTEISRDANLMEVIPALTCEGEYVEVTAPGYEPTRIMFGSAGAGCDRADPVIETPPRSVPVQLRITTDDPKRSFNAVVEVRRIGTPLGTKIYGPLAWRSAADKEGNVVFPGFRVDCQYEVVAWCDGFRPFDRTFDWQHGVGFSVEKIHLRAQAPLELHIRQADGGIPDNAVVVVNTKEFLHSIPCGKDGTCRITCWDEGSTITVVRQGSVSTTTTCSAVKKSGGQLVLEPSGTIRGRVTDSDGAAQGGVIILGGAVGFFDVRDTRGSDHLVARGFQIAVSDNTGAFSIPGGPNTQLLALYPSDWPHRMSNTPVLCNKGDLSRIGLRVR